MPHEMQEASSIPVCPKCGAKHFPHEPCRASGEEAVALCSLCMGPHITQQCPVLDPTAAWEQPVLPPKPVIQPTAGRDGRRRRRRRRGRRS